MHRILMISVLLVPCVMIGCVASVQMPSPEIERGRYVVEIMGCNDCHTPGYMMVDVPEEDWLTGGTRGFHGSWGTAYPTNLRLMLNGMSEEDWLLLARQMRNDSPMAWVRLSKVTEQDLRAVYRFVKNLGPKGVPAPDRLPPGVMPTTDYLEFPEPH